MFILPFFIRLLECSWLWSFSQAMGSSVSITQMIYTEPISWDFHIKLGPRQGAAVIGVVKTFAIQRADSFQLGCFWWLLSFAADPSTLCRPILFSWRGSSDSWSCQLLILRCQTRHCTSMGMCKQAQCQQHGSRGGTAVFTQSCLLWIY